MYMKRIVVVLAVIILFGANFGFCQKIQEKNVPQAVKLAVQKQYPQVKETEWQKENEHYEAEFIQNGTEISLLLDAQGNIMETEIEISVEMLPQKVREYVSQNYPKEKIKEAAKITDAKGNLSYEAEIKKTDLYFDAQGNFISAKNK